MAKKASGEPRPFHVTLNGWDGHWDVEAVDEAAAIAHVQANTEAVKLRDKRNFTATPRDRSASEPSAPVPPMGGGR